MEKGRWEKNKNTMKKSDNNYSNNDARKRERKVNKTLKKKNKGEGRFINS